VVSCERTVRAGGDLVKYAGMLSIGEWIAEIRYSHGTRSPQGLGPSTGYHPGRGFEQIVAAKG